MAISAINSISSITSSTLTKLAQTTSSVKDPDGDGDTETTEAQTKAGGARKAGGAAPAGGAKPAATAASSSSSTSSSAKIYDRRDTNQDGVVSQQEALAYELTHPNDVSQTQPANASAQLQSGLKAYQQSQGSNTKA